MSTILNRLTNPLIRPFAEFFKTESSGGIVLLVSSIVSLLLANSNAGLATYFPSIWNSMIGLSINDFHLEKTLAHWINDGLMTLFFLIVGLEIKREMLEGELSTVRQAALPLLSALGGMLVPAFFYALFNRGTATVAGWGIPMATDIAFALAVLYLLGDRVPWALRIFLTALAIADDLGAVIVIAVFYTQKIYWSYLAWASGIWGMLLLLNRLNVRTLPPYLLLGLVLWYFTLQSGIHATIAGVLLAVTIPFRIQYSREQVVGLVQNRLGIINASIAAGDVQPRDISEELEDVNDTVSSPAQRLEHYLHGPVAFLVIPLFAFCNASIELNSGLINQLLTPLSVGIIVGLVVGKPLGITFLVWLAVRFRWSALPEGVRWRHIVGVATLAGIGFTMSIFVTLLAFENQPMQQGVAKLAIFLASLLSGLIGYVILRTSSFHEESTRHTGL